MRTERVVVRSVGCTHLCPRTTIDIFYVLCLLNNRNTAYPVCSVDSGVCPISNDASTVVSSYISRYLPSAVGCCVLASVTVSTGYRVDGNRRLTTGGFGGSLLIRRRFAISRPGTASFAKGSAALSYPALSDFRFLFSSVCACRAPLR